MTSDRIYVDYLEDLLDAPRKSQSFIAGMGFEQFVEDDKESPTLIPAIEEILIAEEAL